MKGRMEKKSKGRLRNEESPVLKQEKKEYEPEERLKQNYMNSQCNRVKSRSLTKTSHRPKTGQTNLAMKADWGLEGKRSLLQTP